MQIKNSLSVSDVRHSTVSGVIQLEFNQGGIYRVFSNTVDGYVQVTNNLVAGPFTSAALVGDNTIKGNLQCSGNTFAPITSSFGPNIVEGKKQGQCAGL